MTLNDYIKMASFDTEEEYFCDQLDVNETISELSYLTHDYFRYYGKFPSKVAKTIIDFVSEKGAITPTSDYIFDNYNGSGTSLVEAKIAGYDSGGIDINPFGVLASNVKTQNLNVHELRMRFQSLIEKLNSNKDCVQETLFQFSGKNEDDYVGIQTVYKKIYLEFPDIDKWFDTDTIYDLSVIKYYLLQMPQDEYRAFFLLGFFSIIRRVSRAYDAEVRPHVNSNKKKRNVFEAFEKKLSEMISTMCAWNQVASASVSSHAFLCDNSDSGKVCKVIESLNSDYKKKLGLVISHPPYLNCFDYIPVYRLKFLWAFGFDEIYGQLSYKEIKNEEIRSYPATTDSFIYDYFEHNLKAYSIIYDQLKTGGYCCVVIGDCTINKQLFSVHKITYRSTAYGMGRYAYRHKADYNEKENGKKDAIIYFKKQKTGD